MSIKSTQANPGKCNVLLYEFLGNYKLMGSSVSKLLLSLNFQTLHASASVTLSSLSRYEIHSTFLFNNFHCTKHSEEKGFVCHVYQRIEVMEVYILAMYVP